MSVVRFRPWPPVKINGLLAFWRAGRCALCSSCVITGCLAVAAGAGRAAARRNPLQMSAAWPLLGARYTSQRAGVERYTVRMSSSEPWSIVQLGRDAAASAAPARARVAIGFGSPADDTGVARLDLNDILVKHPQATFLLRAAGDAMRDAGIDDGDLLLVDRAIAPAHGHIVIAVVDDEFICRRLCRQGSEVQLRASDPARASIAARDGQELQVWGVVTHAIKTMPV